MNNYLQIIKNEKFDYIVLYENEINNHLFKNCINEKFATSNNFLRDFTDSPGSNLCISAS